MSQIIKLLTNLIKHGLRPELGSGELPQTIEPEMVQKLMELAQMHDLTSIVGSALLDQNLVSVPELYMQIQKKICKEAAVYEKMNYDLQWLRNALTEGKIPFIPLKGSVVRQYYPEPWMRSSCDIDILIHKEMLDDTISYLVDKGCRIYCDEKQHDVSLVTPGNVHLELHYRLLESVDTIDNVLGRVWEHSCLVADQEYEYRQSGAFLLFHLLAHMAYHLMIGGCGIRSFVDIWLLCDRMEYDKELFGQLCCEAKLERFFDNVQRLIGVWFAGEEHTAVTKQLESIVISGGTYGSLDNRILIDQAQTGGKRKRLLKRIFMPYEGLKTQYPVLISHRWLTPVFQVVRWFRIFTGGRLRRAIGEYKTSRSHSDEQVNSAKSFLNNVGLDF